MPGSAYAFSGAGSGTSTSPYEITTCSQLHETGDALSANYLLMNDINCTGFSFTPIGDTTSSFFTGTLDGGGHTITNLTISSNENGVAIFEKLGSGGLITNIGIASGSITSGEDVVSMGSFAANVSGGSITNSYSKAVLDGSAAFFIDPVIGGLLGKGDPVTVSNSYYAGNITNGTANPNYTAGIAGYLSAGSIANSYSTGSITNGQNVGGLAGRLFSGATITNSFSTMTFVNASSVGALVGTITSGTISNSYWNDTSGGFFTCYFGGNTGCTRVNNNTSYFYTISNSPMGSWDFTDTWSRSNDGVGYPLLNWQSPNPTPTPTPTPSSSQPNSGSSSPAPVVPSCGDMAPIGEPKIFQIDTNKDTATLYFSPVSGQNTAYAISYGMTANANEYATTFSFGKAGGVISYTINDLFPGKWYFKVLGANGCMPGGWSNSMSATLHRNSATYFSN